MDKNQNPIALSQLAWPEVDAYIATGKPLLLPLGSFEQHGPMGLMGTDYLCAETVAMAAAEIAGWLVAPALVYTPAPFNMAFAGTVSLSAPTFTLLLEEVCQCFINHGFKDIYLLNGHGANLEPARQVIKNLAPHAKALEQLQQRLQQLPRALALRPNIQFCLADCGLIVSLEWITMMYRSWGLPHRFIGLTADYQQDMEQLPWVAAELNTYRPLLTQWIQTKSP